MSASRLAIVLDRLLPGDEATGWPAAGALGLADRAMAMAAERDDLGRLEAALALLPETFDTAPEAAQIAALEALEAQAEAAFSTLILYAYGAYYTDPRVRRVVERRTGYPARPPQPDGYELPPFDETLLDRVRRRAPFWRRVEE